MQYDRAKTCKRCFAICFGVGCFFLFMVPLEEALPYAALDGVLTQEELRNQVTHDIAMKLLISNHRGRWILWALAGVPLTLASGVGYWAARGAIGLKKPLELGIDEV